MYEIYRTTARELGLRMSPDDPGMMTFFIDLDGTVDGRPVHVRRVVGAGGFFVVESSWSPSLGAGLSVSSAGLLDRIGELVGVHDTQLGDAAFDDAFRVRARDPERAKQILRPEVRAALTGLEGDVKLHDEGVSVRVSHRDESVDLLTRLCRSVARLASIVR